MPRSGLTLERTHRPSRRMYRAMVLKPLRHLRIRGRWRVRKFALAIRQFHDVQHTREAHHAPTHVAHCHRGARRRHKRQGGGEEKDPMPDVWSIVADLDTATQGRLAAVLETRGA